MGFPSQINSNTPNGTGEVLKLAALIIASVEEVVKEYQLIGTNVPSLYSLESGPFDTSQSMSKKLSMAVQTIEAACAQLCCTVAPPGHVIINKANTFQEPVGLQIVTSAKVADILLEAPQGLPINILGHRTGMDPNKLGRILRNLATRHCFSEVKPNVFANNRISMQLVSTNPVSSYIGHITDLPLKAVVHLDETLTDPSSAFSSSPSDSTFRRVHGAPIFGSPDKPMPPMIRDRFARAMAGWSSVTAGVPLSKSYNWGDVADDTVVCDIGGGNGHAMLALSKDFPNIKVVLHDMPAVVEQAKTYWNVQNPEFISLGRIEFVGLNFFVDTPVKGCDFYYLRHVLHDWPTNECIKILQNVRKAMSPCSRLLIQEYVLQPATQNCCGDEKVPEPLLSNYGMGRIRRYNQDITMMNVLNGQERTLQDFQEIGSAAGFAYIKLWDTGEEGLLEFMVEI